ncbi:MAG: DNA repair protein RadA [Patescibacteria group bacterium]|nr:MAG: DNA repair protein RadA [Patescibacteria group bacterium]
MAKGDTVFVCQNCGWTTAKWVGQCYECHTWNAMVEELPIETIANKKSAKAQKIEDFTVTFSQVETLSASKSRLSTNIDEFDRVLGGEDSNFGMVLGSVMLIGGEPGIGKSTLLTQMVVGMLQPSKTGSSKSEHKFMYVCGEENPAQVALRIERIAKQFHENVTTVKDNLIFVTTADVDAITAAMQKLKPRCVVVDSIQTVTTTDLSGAAGSVGQVRECAERLTTTAKALHIPLFLVGHVTKEGVISGPKVLEHIVDSVLELSGDRTGDLRILRAIKNRFGATDEVGVFRMREYGFESVSNPSELFLEYADTQVPGSITACVMEGTRPLLVEIQALVVESQLAMPRRVGRGINLPRIQVLSAVLQKHCYLPLGSTDIFASVAGGFEVKEPSIDLGLAVAMASSLNNKPIKEKTVFIGEIGLLGEIRSVNLLDRRIKEAKRLGFTNIISKKTHKSVRQVLSDLQLLKSKTT